MKKILSLLIGLLLVHSLTPGRGAAANSPAERSKRALLAQKAKAVVAQLGAGKSSVVRVELYDRSKYHGHIAEVGDASFVISDTETGATAAIDYAEVKSIKGNNLSAGAKVGIGIVVATAATAIIIGLVKGRGRDNGEGRSGPCQPPRSGDPCPDTCICAP